MLQGAGSGVVDGVIWILIETTKHAFSHAATPPPPSVNVFQEGCVESCLHGYLTSGINTINGIKMSIIWMQADAFHVPESTT